jgi:hypothetical protein
VEPGAVQSEIWRKGQEAMDAVDRSHKLFKLYERSIDGIERIARKATAKAIPAIAVARVVERCLNSRSPRARYLVGHDAKLGVLLKRILPTSILDAIFVKAFGI